MALTDIKLLKLTGDDDKEEILEVELFKGSKGLGFTIAGGIGAQHIPGDNGVYITMVTEGGAAAADGQIAVGDRLVAVADTENEYFFLENCTHKESVDALKNCKDTVLLLVAKANVDSSSHVQDIQNGGYVKFTPPTPLPLIHALMHRPRFYPTFDPPSGRMAIKTATPRPCQHFLKFDSP